MKILVIVNSTHQQNTMKIAEAMAEVAPITIVDVNDAERHNVANYDIVGYGSGIYAGKFGKKILKHINKNINSLKNVFLFSTSATGNVKYNEKLVSLLNNNGKTVLGSFTCKSFCKWFIFAIGGGINKGHPDIEDFESAQTFVEQVMKKFNNANN